ESLQQLQLEHWQLRGLWKSRNSRRDFQQTRSQQPGKIRCSSTVHPRGSSLRNTDGDPDRRRSQSSHRLARRNELGTYPSGSSKLDSETDDDSQVVRLHNPPSQWTGRHNQPGTKGRRGIRGRRNDSSTRYPLSEHQRRDNSRTERVAGQFTGRGFFLDEDALEKNRGSENARNYSL